MMEHCEHAYHILCNEKILIKVEKTNSYVDKYSEFIWKQQCFKYLKISSC